MARGERGFDFARRGTPFWRRPRFAFRVRQALSASAGKRLNNPVDARPYIAANPGRSPGRRRDRIFQSQFGGFMRQKRTKLAIVASAVLASAIAFGASAQDKG